jgi:F-type H+-transporting ATPase subunit gamma
VSTRREVERRLESLGEIREVMNSMKMLAYMETRKLARFIAIQRRQVAAIEAMAADLLSQHPGVRPAAGAAGRGLILIGAERGFCGDFNGRIARAMRESGKSVVTGAIIAVGRRMGTRLEGGIIPTVTLNGASAAEQVASVLEELTRSIATIQQKHGSLAMTVIYHGGEDGSLVERPLLPTFEEVPAAPRRFGCPLQLTLAPPTLFAALLDQYLYAALSQMLYASLTAESHKRMQHLDSAIRHLDHRREELARRSRLLRQEEIIEEIEVILLNVDAAGTSSRDRGERTGALAVREELGEDLPETRGWK